MCNHLSCGLIAESKNCYIIWFMGKRYVITGGMSTPHSGWDKVWGMQVVYLETYKTFVGAIRPLKYSAHNNEVNAGRRERGYMGMQIMADGRWVVFIGESITFTSNGSGMQTELFSTSNNEQTNE